MERQIKFRAWNTEDKKIEYPITFAICLDGKFKPLIKCSDGSNAYKDYPLMQFTGLLDKNGKEIYEGDIILVNYSGEWLKEKVIFDNGAFRKTFRDDSNDVYKLPFTSRSPYNTEVIGNIYENPELK
jgi:uncharacterized phage protein (TIGR01671 family)